MNNVELEKRIKDIFKKENFFDVVMELKSFEKEYKDSDFYKATKMPLLEMAKLSKGYYATQLEDIGAKIQKIINNLNFDNLSKILDQADQVFQNENQEIEGMLDKAKEIFKA